MVRCLVAVMDVAITFFLFLLFPGPILLDLFFFPFLSFVRFTTESSPGELKRVAGAGAWLLL